MIFSLVTSVHKCHRPSALIGYALMHALFIPAWPASTSGEFLAHETSSAVRLRLASSFPRRVDNFSIFLEDCQIGRKEIAAMFNPIPQPNSSPIHFNFKYQMKTFFLH